MREHRLAEDRFLLRGVGESAVVGEAATGEKEKINVEFFNEFLGVMPDIGNGVFKQMAARAQATDLHFGQL